MAILATATEGEGQWRAVLKYRMIVRHADVTPSPGREAEVVAAHALLLAPRLGSRREEQLVRSVRAVSAEQTRRAHATLLHTRG